MIVKTIIFFIWLLFVIAWNFYYPTATPLEDVFMAVCFSLFSKSLERNLATP
jgi:hypothetical protein